jgi:hypothetical protein
MRTPENTTVTSPADAKALPVAPDAVPSCTVGVERIDYVKPTIFLMGDEFIDLADYRTQSKKWTPDRAFVTQGMLVIEEYGISLPASYVKAIRVAKKAVTP